MIWRLSLLCALAINSPNIYAQIADFEHLGLDDGLSQVSVMSVTQDSMGSIWIGTRNGLNRYDGEDIIVYRSQKTPETIRENQIKELISEGHHIWIRTPNYISTYDILTDRFKSYSVSNLNSFCWYQRDLWVSTPNSLQRLDTATDELISCNLNLRPNESIELIYPYKSNLLIATQKALWQRTLEGKTQMLVDNLTGIVTLYTDSHDNIWIGTSEHGLIRLDLLGHQRHYNGEHLSHPFVRKIQEDDNGNIWVGTFNGLDVIKTDQSIAHYKHDKTIRSSLSHNSIWALYKDRTGAIWVGTYYGGVNLFHPTLKFFNYYSQNSINNVGLNFKVVGQVIEDAKKDLWICTDGGGLNHFDHQSNTFSYYTNQKDKNSISHDNVKCLYNQGDSILWLGTHRGGLNKYDIRYNQFTTYLPESHSEGPLKTTEIGDIVALDNRLIVATEEGVLQFDMSKRTFARYLSSRYDTQIKGPVRSLLLDDQQNLWIGTESEGLFKYDISRDSLYNYIEGTDFSLPSNSVFVIFQDHLGHIWIGTSNGLSLYHPDRENFESYTLDNGLPGNYVYGIVESRFGGLIVATNSGISFFNENKKSFKNITIKNGLPVREITPKGLYLTSDGNVVVSSIDGMAIFSEKELLDMKPVTSPRINGLSINNKKISSQSSNIISKPIQFDPAVKLKHEHSTVSFRFSDMAYSKAGKQPLEYMLEGFDTDWIKAGTRNEATYTNLNDGEYEFKVRFQKFPEYQHSVRVVMTPPFYLSITAYILYGLMAVGLLIFINYQYLSRNRLAYRLKLEKEKHDQDEALNQSKIRFFTNISHEFRTPLTLISGQIELLMEQQDLKPSQYKRILNVYKNTQRLRNLISELLDFRKQEQGHLKLKVAQHDFVPFIQEIYLSFVELAKHTDIDYNLNHAFRSFNLWFDQMQLEKVFYNLLSNAFKFTKEHGQIMINLIEETETLAIEVINTGVGIPQPHIDKIFDRFYQLENLESASQHSTGIGLALTKGIIDAHKGHIKVSSAVNGQTIFTVRIPLGNKHFSPDEMIKKETELVIATDIQSSLLIPSIDEHTNETILVVEDNIEVSDFLENLLSPLYFVKTAPNGKEGLEMAEKIQPSLILSDVLMPKMSGTEMCAAIKTNISTSHIPLILLTARTAEEHTIEGLETGADDYISKPFNTKILLARINNIISNRKSLQEKYAKDPIPYAKKIAKGRIDKEFLEKAQAVVVENITNPKYDVAAFSKDMTLGRTNLFAKIKGITGQTPNEFILSIKLSKAAQMILHEPNMTMAEIAYACGYSNPHYFSRSFKKHFGMTPSQYQSQ